MWQILLPIAKAIIRTHRAARGASHTWILSLVDVRVSTCEQESLHKDLWGGKIQSLLDKKQVSYMGTIKDRFLKKGNSQLIKKYPVSWNYVL